ncbi:facilitated trehalose transporter Tret1 [Hyalella azteca]|uniref:Facilitated trehalose transporter Tret1 n=1 Tax=Hyalella azteca TaxID=294128 RepID=A0A8B7PEG0_HYAAZ|nr:facilitated trehalose transporter Tret1 [Hyalella azteca]
MSWYNVFINTYIGETASPDIRGNLGSSFQISYALGVVYSYVLGMCLPWQQLALTCLGPPVACTLLLSYFPESPTFLLLRNRTNQAKAALQTFRGRNVNIEEEFGKLQQLVHSNATQEWSWSLITQATVYKPLLIVGLAYLARASSGVNGIESHSSLILKAARGALPDQLSATLFIVFSTVSCFIVNFIIDSVGRKPLLIASASGVSICLGSLALYLYILEKAGEQAVKIVSWLPLLCLTVYGVAYNIGYGCVTGVLLGEMLPPWFKERAGAITMLTTNTMHLLMVILFSQKEDSLESYGLFLALAALNTAAAILIALFVKETKGKTLQEISELFEKRPKLIEYGSIDR